MEQSQIALQFQDFLTRYSALEKDMLWQEQSYIFKIFWNSRIMADSVRELNDAEVDDIIRFIDIKAKGNSLKSEAIAKILIPQGVWRRMFKQIKADTSLAIFLDQIMGTFDDVARIKLINELYKYNEPYRNSLTGQKGNALNALIFLWAPSKNVSIVSLSDRQRLIKFLGLKDVPDFEKASPGEKIVKSNEVLLKGFSEIFGNQHSPRTICTFFYNTPIRDEWRAEDIGEEVSSWGGKRKQLSHPDQVTTKEIIEGTDQSLFYMESQLEDFLIENWDKTELGKKYDLIEENDEIVSQQYRTDIGRIDILAKDKKEGHLIVIELKKDQTSDDTVGQLARYMGWLEEHKTNSEPTKGIIIAAKYDQRLYYALKKIKDVEVYLYKVDFQLKEFKE